MYSGAKVLKISLIIPMDILHELINDQGGIVMALLGQVEIDHGGHDAVVTEISLYDSQIHPLLQEVGGIRMAQGMDTDAALVDVCRFSGVT